MARRAVPVSLVEEGFTVGENASRDQQLSDVLSEFARTMATDFPIQAILDHLIDRIVEMLPITAAGVTMIVAGRKPRYIAASDPTAMRYEELQDELGEGPCLLAFTSGQLVAVPDLGTETRFPAFAPRALADGMRAVFTFPLRHGTHQLGALDLYRETPGPLSQQATSVAQTLADVAAAYLINAQAREDLELASERSKELALHDGLTGLPNRTLLLERLRQALQRSRRTGKTTSVIFIDLDKFKTINDTHGHSTGNQLLVAVAGRLQSILRPSDTVARMHGDEFVVICEDLDDPEQAAPIVGRLSQVMAEPFTLPSATIAITASVGIAFADRDVRDAEQILRDADAAMYEAKRRGAGLHRVSDPRYRHVARTGASLEHDLRDALPGSELHTEYQPIMDTVSRSILGFEALVRWDHPERGPVAPATFIPLAEHSELITEIGAWVLRQACADRRSWQTLHPDRSLDIAVNVSTRQLMSATFVNTVDEVLQVEKTEPDQLTLEITEGVFVDDSDGALVVLNDLRDLGVRIALDDFGTGYSSLSYLNQFPVDIVKIDRSFVKNLGSDRVSNIIATAVVQLAHALDMTVVAEGIETEQQHHAVAALGCDAAQGFYYAPPMVAASAAMFLQAAADGQPLPAAHSSESCRTGEA
jgi:diguanylate cyclase (GGDEF)-like protein